MKMSNGDGLISTDALKDFFSLVQPDGSKDVMQSLGQSSYIRSVLSIIDPDIRLPAPSDARSNIKDICMILSEVEDSFNGKYSTELQETQRLIISLSSTPPSDAHHLAEVVSPSAEQSTDAELSKIDSSKIDSSKTDSSKIESSESYSFDGVIPLNIRRRLGEAVLIIAIESSRAAEIVGRIVTDLTEDTQLEIQTMIEKYAQTIDSSLCSDSSYLQDESYRQSSSFRRGLTSLDGREEGDREKRSDPSSMGRVLGQTPCPAVVPPLSLGLLKQMTMKRGKSSATSPEQTTEKSKAESSLWKEKYDKLKQVGITTSD